MNPKLMNALVSALMQDGDEGDDNARDERKSDAQMAKELREYIDVYAQNSERQWKRGDLVKIAKGSTVHSNWGVGVVSEVVPGRRRTEEEHGTPHEDQPASVRVFFQRPSDRILGYWYDPGDLRPWTDKSLQ